MPLYRPLVPIPELGPHEVCADDVRGPILAWKMAVEARGGVFHVNSLTRTALEQQSLRDAYVDWLNGGKKAPAVAAANKPGRSNHQGGRAADVSTVGAFPNAPKDRQVDLLWETGKPLGWTPIIAAPDETRSECWHFDFFGDWSGVRDHLGYDIACLCSALDVGQAGEWQSDDRLLQALFLRAGFDVGEPDGVFGRRSRKALGMTVGIDRTSNVDLLAELLRGLPARTEWVKVV